MYLYDRLQICLLSLHNRYPGHIVEFDASIFEQQDFCEQYWTAEEVIEILQNHDPHLLQAMAYMVIDAHESNIYLGEYTQGKRVLQLHCHGRIPKHTGDLTNWKKQSIDMAVDA
ncbi:hypothetical protein [Dictyobacter kobayashii]|uniref:Uncharacterized protein n=1 Tax=Dictyobacter kobayashii TaxID=2014872 RepID=A0A402AW92_9CHLR|nr:hypothetical protein [Dictyobacter kobayashii]GCE23335.1 hypothetical protein KDK_71350 [Dictyobacter kobayashii]